MLIFSGISILFLLFMYIATRKIKAVFRIPLLLTVAGITSFFIYYFIDSARGSEEQWFKITPWKHIILFISMSLGMITNYLYDYLMARIKAKEAKEAGKENIKMPIFIWEKFVLPFVISFLLFGYVWGQYADAEMSLFTVCSSYQNGFFWQTIFGKIKPKEPGA